MTARYRRAQHETPITTELQALIARRRAEVVDKVYEVLTDAHFVALPKHANNTRAGLVYNKWLGLVKLALVNEGRALLTNWREIKTELNIPWAVFYNDISLVAWAAVSNEVESTFFKTKTTGFDDIDLQLHQGAWLPVETTASGYGVVEPDDALLLLGLVGGVLPSESHAQPPFAVRDLRFDAARGVITTARLTSRFGEYPVAYEKTSTFYPEITVAPDGEVTVVPLVDASLGIIAITVEGTDGFRETAHATVSVNIVEAAL